MTKQEFNKKYYTIEKKAFRKACNELEEHYHRMLLIVGLVCLFLGLLFGTIYGKTHAKYVPYTSTDTYVVEKGDTLWSIAEEIGNNKYDIRLVVDEIKNINDCSSSIKPRDVLTIPVLE